MNSTIQLVFLMGPTSVGKTYLCEYAQKEFDAHIVCVGKMLRMQYGEDYFEGKQAPSKTTEEALHMMVTGINEGIISNKNLILVDGKPRELVQIKEIEERYMKVFNEYDLSVSFMILHCDEISRKSRCDKRNSKVSTSRFDSDIIEIKDMIYELVKRGFGQKIISLNTGLTEINFGKWYRNTFEK